MALVTFIDESNCVDFDTFVCEGVRRGIHLHKRMHVHIYATFIYRYYVIYINLTRLVGSTGI